MTQLDPSWVEALGRWLGAAGLGGSAAVIDVERIGEGNMNLVVRARFGDGRSVVVKEARPFVERYPHIPAPVERADVEAAFGRAVAGAPDVARRMPRLLVHDPVAHRVAFEDLAPHGGATDLGCLYRGARLEPELLDAWLAWAERLHALRPDGVGAGYREVLRNRAMRALNHAHIFELPFRAEPPRDLDGVLPGLAAVHAAVVATQGVVEAAAALGEVYLADGDALVHGDLYPGSVLVRDGQLFVLDAEFGFFGDPSFDRGVLAAHLVLSGQDDRLVARALAGAPARARAFAGVEILRRLLGVAQLPLDADLSTRAAWVAQGVAWTLGR